eukprot:COSAG05_NODE_3778_length_1842_cov_1.183592_1_plen_35_part_00
MAFPPCEQPVKPTQVHIVYVPPPACYYTSRPVII